MSEGSLRQSLQMVSAVGAVAVLAGMFAPLFSVNRDRDTLSLWSLHDRGVPGITALLLGTIAIVVTTLLPGRYQARALGRWILGVAVVVALGVPLALCVGYVNTSAVYFSDFPRRYVGFRWGLPLLVLGLATMLVGVMEWRHRMPATTQPREQGGHPPLVR
ncbi:hypothetical protein FOH10_09990 [Nocardia otitidiscaviarum]|uniref:Uncharacterized protein n=1 Tax=Nocardia otitidiscaviarum TaxID=1823 RepID=A0A516NJC7_9NOCA|nr:hypothetical protein [Nocardia otitidiscaviarum]MCP9618900.1 hypothetical protein [Nocardia otitidiscaviarum]QDP79014.1 hypothetical protein FOH10_09990 [Nocardia otitidiscaviarum]